MINGVELIVLDEPQQMRELESDDTGWLQRNLKAADKVIDVWDVGENVAAEKKVGGFAIGQKFLRRLNAKEFYDTRNLLLFPCNFRDVGGRLDAKNGNALGLKMLKKVSVVTGDFDDLAIRIKVETLHHHLAITACMLDPAGREAGKIQIVAKDRVRRLELFEL